MSLRSGVVCALLLSSPVSAREPLSLGEAIERALERNPRVVGAVAEAEASAARVDQARGAFLPRLDYVESATRSDNPVFVFGSLLNQRKFTEEHFDVDRLNHPSPLNLFQSRFTLRQTIFAGGRNYLELQSRKLGREQALEGQREAEMQVIFQVVQSYYGIQIAERHLQVVQDAVAVAEEDLRRSRAMREAGMATDADVLSLQVHVADLQQKEIEARNLVSIQRAELNEVLGEPLDEELVLITPLADKEVRFEHEPEEPEELEKLEKVAVESHPALRRSELAFEAADLARRLARSSFLPSVDLDAGWESDRAGFTGDGGTNWLLGVSLRFNLFNGLRDRAAVQEAAAKLRKARAEKTQAESRVRLELRRAYLELAAARRRRDVALRTAEQARESHRITRSRHEAGLASVTDLLRSHNVLLTTEVRQLSAAFEVRLAAAAVELAAGTLSPESEAIKP